MEPKISAVILTFKNIEKLCANLESIRNQSRKPDEIIVVDGGSKDITSHIVRSKYPDIKLIIHHRDCGIEALNLGIANATGDYICTLDDDVILDNDWFKRLELYFSQEPEQTGAIATQIIEKDKIFWPYERQNESRYIGNFIGCGVAFRKKAIEEVGYYEDWFFLFGNEYEYSLRMLNKGYCIKYIPSIITFHDTSSAKTPNARFVYYFTRNTLYTAIKYFPIFLLPIGILYISNSGLKMGLRTKGGIRSFSKAVYYVIRLFLESKINRQPCKNIDFLNTIMDKVNRESKGILKNFVLFYMRLMQKQNLLKI